MIYFFIRGGLGRGSDWQHDGQHAVEIDVGEQKTSDLGHDAGQGDKGPSQALQDWGSQLSRAEMVVRYAVVVWLWDVTTAASTRALVRGGISDMRTARRPRGGVQCVQ